MSTFRVPVAAVLIAMLAAVGCKSSEFTGSSSRKPAVEKKEIKVPDETPETPSERPDSKKPDGDEPDEPVEDPVVDDVGDDQTPVVDTDTDQSNKPSILDILEGLKKIIFPEDTINDENRIVFGNAKGFHIGDDNFDPNSNCATRLKMHNINGSKYFFEFEVKKDDTRIDITINEVCGVDYADTNFASIEDAAGTAIQKKPVPGNSAIKYDSVVLKAGKYKMVVESTPNAQNNNDRDDFMVKKLEIKSDKPIIAGKIGAQ